MLQHANNCTRITTKGLIHNWYLSAVFILELLEDEIPSPKFSDSPPKMLRYVINYISNTNYTLKNLLYS